VTVPTPFYGSESWVVTQRERERKWRKLDTGWCN